MEREIIQRILKFRSRVQNTKLGGLVRCYSDLPDRTTSSHPQRPERPERKEEGPKYIMKQPVFSGIQVKYWNENRAVRKERQAQKFPYNVNNMTDLIHFCQSWNNFPGSISELIFCLKRRSIRKELAEQKYLPERVGALKSDLAAAHFLVRRGGLVKFVGSNKWVGFSGDKKTLPLAYIPGMFIQAIKAEKTGLIYEGLANLNNLKYLESLSLRNLETMNDWCMDYISNEHCLTLKHLDISGCKNITYRGLSCFYRFECLKTLEVEGIPDTPEFKLACLLLLDIMPDLDIKGIDLTVPEKVDPVNLDVIKDNPESEIPI